MLVNGFLLEFYLYACVFVFKGIPPKARLNTKMYPPHHIPLSTVLSAVRGQAFVH